MRWWQRVLGLLAAALVALVAVLLVVETADEAVDRFRARDGADVEGVVTERYAGGRSVFPDVTVEYAVDGRSYEREIEGFLDLGERVEVRYLRQDPAVSRVAGEGGPALVADVLWSVLVLVAAPFGARAALRDLRRPASRAPARPASAPERAGDRDAWRRRVTRAGAVGGAAGAALWAVLALRLGAGPPREIATASLGLTGSGAVLGVLVGWLRSRGELRRSGQRWTFRLGLLGLLAASPLPLLAAVALEA